MVRPPPIAALRERVAASYPLVLLVTGEEERARRLTSELARAEGMAFAQAEAGRAALEPAAIQALCIAADDPGRTLAFLPDAHRLFGDAAFTRKVRERVPALEANRSTLVLCAPVERVPVELERDMAIVRLALPDGAHLASLVDALLRAGRMEISDFDRDRVARALRGLTESQALRALRRVLGVHRGLGPDAVEDLAREKRDLLGAGGLLELVDEAPVLDDVGGLDQLKAWLTRRRDAMTDRARAFGLPEPRGILLLGVQGCGKSLSAKATAAVLGLPLARLDVARLFTRDFAPEENLRRALTLAEALAPVVLWLDEIEKAFSGMGASGGADGAMSRVFGAFITWLSERSAPVFVAATANRVDGLPPELLRKGRFDEMFFVDLPDAGARAQILAIHLARRGRDPAKFDLAALANLADRRNGAELEQAVLDALTAAFHDGRDIGAQDIADSIEATVPLVETYEEDVKALREWARRRARSAASNRNLAELYQAAARAGADERRSRPFVAPVPVAAVQPTATSTSTPPRRNP